MTERSTMSDWMPGVVTRPSSHNGGSMTGRDAYWVWHTYECGYNVSAMTGARALIAAGNEVHVVFHPITGDIVQILPASVAGRGLRNPAGGVETNRQGRVCIQVEVIGRAAYPWTDDLTPAGRAGLDRLMAYSDTLGVPRRFPAGPTPAYPSGSSPRSVAVWNGPGGHFGHSQVPENTHGDPGAVDCGLILAAGKAPAPSPAPAPAPRPTSKPSRSTDRTRADVRKLQAAVHVTADGIWGPNTDRALQVVRYAAYYGTFPFGVRAAQAAVRTAVDGVWGPHSRAALDTTVRRVQAALRVTVDGDWGPKTDAAFNAARKVYHR